MNWNQALQSQTTQAYFQKLHSFLKTEYATQTVYPPLDKVMKALELTPLDDVKCVILGQDPYHEPGQAMGLSFSVEKGITIPRSLQNIYKELQNEYGYAIPNNGDLTPWAKQGVLLLNSVLTVRAHAAGSHAGQGWETYTDAILTALNGIDKPIVYLLWGNYARAKKTLITNPKQLILETTHPSPFSADRGFLGCGHFRKCNDFLIANNLQPINWQITD